jgi:hypothetical protein
MLEMFLKISKTQGNASVSEGERLLSVLPFAAWSHAFPCHFVNFFRELYVSPIQ